MSNDEWSRPSFILSANFFGDASNISMGFEKLFFIKPAIALAAKIGIGMNSEWILGTADYYKPVYITMPLHITCNFGKNKSFLEMGVGGVIADDDTGTKYLAYPMLGYRYHPFNNPGFSFRIWGYYAVGQIPVQESLSTSTSWLGLSFGLAL
jgi:hypothetical protein